MTLAKRADNVDISCVILTWNSERYIEKCLKSLIADLIQHTLTFEIFIVDNGSSDQTASILNLVHNQHPNNVLPIYLDHNAGTTYSRNLALRRTQGNYIAILDCDVEVFPGTIAHLIQTLEHSRRIAIAVPKLVYSNGDLQKSTDVFPTIMTKLKRFFFLKLFEKRDRKGANDMLHRESDFYEVDYAISAMWILKRDVLENIGLLDEKITYSPEDVDYCLRIWKAGYAIVYDPRVTCVHHAQEISRGTRINRATIQHLLGLCYYFKKHRYIFRRPKFKS